MIFDVKMGENFRCKTRFVAWGHTTETPTSLTYSSVVSRDSVRIILLAAALDGLQVVACDIQNAYLTASCREKIWTYTGPEFGSERKRGTESYQRLYQNTGLEPISLGFGYLSQSRKPNASIWKNIYSQWWEAICNEMRNVRPAFEVWEKERLSTSHRGINRSSAI